MSVLLLARQRRAGLGSRVRAAVTLGRVAGWLSRTSGIGSGAVIGGRVALAIEPHVVRRLCGGRPVALVSGTNGKTTTTRLLSSALSTRDTIASNSTGANMLAGFVAACARPAEQLVLEVDELHLPAALVETGADLVVLLNISRDQLDRINETSRIAQRWRTALQAADPAPIVVADADDPLVAWAAEGSARVRWVATGQPWRDDANACPACEGLLEHDPATGWVCACGRRRPQPEWVVRGGRLEGPAGVLPLSLALPGAVNEGNAALAVVAAVERGVDAAEALAAVSAVQSVGGRYRRYPIRGRDVRLLLAKNPAGWTETLALLADGDRGSILAINARLADGRDTSWLWDVPFERLAGRRVVAIGERRLDLAVRLQTAGVDCVVADGVRAALAAVDGDIDIVGNYTAFQALARELDHVR